MSRTLPPTPPQPITRQPRLKKWLYVQCYITKQTPQAALLIPLMEAATGKPQPDAVPPITPDMLNFRGVLVEAADDNDAYYAGECALGRHPDAICQNDWVRELP